MGLLGNDWNGKIFVDGWTDGRGEPIKVTAPATGEQLAVVGTASVEDVGHAAARAAAAQDDWAARPPMERAAVLRRAGALFEEHAAEIQDWIVRESGSIPPKAGLETLIAAQECYEASALPSHPSGEVLPTNAGALELRPAPSGRRRHGDRAVQLPADPLDPLGRAGARARQRRAAQARPAHGGLRRRRARARSSGEAGLPDGVLPCCRAVAKSARRPSRRRKCASSRSPDLRPPAASSEASGRST